MFTLAVVTGTRAEYGLLRPVLFKLMDSAVLRPLLLVTGSHLSAQYGHTVDEIEADGLPIAARIDILSAAVPPHRAGTAMRYADAVRQFSAFWAEGENTPDAVLLLGDRYEVLAAGSATTLLDIPLCHISGGDVTYGADDDSFRHCLTKMAKLHFPSCEAYRQRVIRMGEQPAMVHNVGGLGDENIRNMQLLSRKTLGAGLSTDLTGLYALVTLHPETQSQLPPRQQLDALLAALQRFPQLTLLCTGANADAGGDEINRRLAAFCEEQPNAVFVPSLGTLRYLSAMKHAAVVVGNSSSGVVETPSLGVPAVDIGHRQAGRLHSENILHCDMQSDAIASAIETALSPAFATAARRTRSPYNGGDTSGRIVAILEECLQSGHLRQPKEFYDGEAGL